MTKNKIKDLLSYLVVIGLSIFISSTILFSYQVNGISMYPTLEENDRGIALRTTFNIKKINRFDIVVIDNSGRFLVKRVIGLPGDEVEYKDNKLYINGEYVEEKFLSNTHTDDLYVKVEENSYFCLGDNREHSSDSRAYGSFLKDNIKAILFK